MRLKDYSEASFDFENLRENSFLADKVALRNATSSTDLTPGIIMELLLQISFPSSSECYTRENCLIIFFVQSVHNLRFNICIITSNSVINY